MKRIICLICAAVLLLPCLALGEEAEEIETIVTIVSAPEQTKAERPPCFPDPADDYIPLPETENFALNKPVKAGAHTDVYVEKNVNDGKPTPTGKARASRRKSCSICRAASPCPPWRCA